MFDFSGIFNVFSLPAFAQCRIASPTLVQLRVRSRGRLVAVDRRKAAKLRALRRAKRLGQA